MTALKRRIVDLIEALGPIPVADYMALCLSDPQHGYYMNRDPFGAGGDFTTAPEISQMFGELIGAWIAETWTTIGAPADIIIAEIGPGRGTLAKDVARTLGKIAPNLRESGRFALIETSKKLRLVQETTLKETGAGVGWYDTVDALPEGPIIIIGNEIFDAIPSRQYVRARGGWRERVVALGDDGGLIFAAGPGSVDSDLLPPEAAAAADGAIVELSPARTGLMQTIAERIARHGGAGLFFDYGYLQPTVGDTLQALLNHAYDDPLAHPGEADLTTHVDFASLAHIARAVGLDVRLATQGDFLLRLGLLERAGALGAPASQAHRDKLQGEVERLAAPGEMGQLFKVLAIAVSATHLPGFGAD